MIRQREEVELQKSITLDDALLAGVETFRNGCNFRLLGKSDGSYWLEMGCYLLVNLAQGEERLLMSWLGGRNATEPKQLDGLVKPETIMELLKRDPCQCCGAPFLQKRA